MYRSSSHRAKAAVEGTLDGEAGNVLLTRKSRAKDRSCFTIDGPFRIELDDLAGEVLASLDPHWLTQISAPAGAVERSEDRQRASAPYCEKPTEDQFTIRNCGADFW